MVHYDTVAAPRYNSRISILTTKNDDGKIVSLSLNMDGRLYRTYNPQLEWNIRVSFPTPSRTIAHTGQL